MKNLLAAACLTAGLTSASPANGPGDEPKTYPKSVAIHATALTQALAQRIHFNEGQYVQIKKLHLNYLEQRRQLEFELKLADAPAAGLEGDENIELIHAGEAFLEGGDDGSRGGAGCLLVRAEGAGASVLQLHGLADGEQRAE